MIIENPDVFKTWLTSILEPLCDADPAALAKYVYALVKKEKPISELRDVMVDQLDVFLQHETKPFVEMLFKSLESNEYLKPREADMKPPTPTPEQESEKELVASEPLGVGTVVAVSNGSSPPRAPAPPAPPVPAPAPPVRRVVPPRAPPLKRVAPPLEQTLVKVLPLTELLEEPVDQPPRRRDRRNDLLRDKEDRRRRRSRSGERRARLRRDPRHPRDFDHERRRLSSRSPSPRRYRNRSPPPPPDRAPSRSRSRSPVAMRDRELERERERLRVPRELERDRMSRDREHRERMSRSRERERSRDRSRDRSRGSVSPRDSRLDINDAYKRRCRDFDEKGYCMRGDLCQWDHGADPVVLEDAALSSVLTMPHPVPEYNPLAPDIWMAPGFPPYPPPQHPPPRELIPIPRVRHAAPAPGAPLAPLPARHAPPKKNFDYNRIGARATGGQAGGNCSLEVRKVPRGMNDITHLNNHFAKFGKIVNIQVCYEGDPEAALITFSNPTEANVAYKSTEAVLNNRFIKVFWHNPDSKQENISPSNQQTNKPSERPNSQHPMSNNKVFINKDNIKATADTKQLLNEKEQKEQANGTTEAKKEAPPAIKTAPSIDKSKKVMDMYKRGQELLETQLHQQILLIQKLESGNVTGAQKAALMEAINSAQEGIEKLRKELVAYNSTLKQMQINAKKPKTREEAQKEILDTELDMFNKQQEGQDVTDLLKKVSELRRQMALNFPVHSNIRRPISARGRFNPSMRFTRGAGLAKSFPASTSLDHRPKALLISGFEADDLDSLYTHFSQFGEVSSKEVELSVPQLVLQYRARAHAEHAMLHGRNYNDRTLSITWALTTKPAAIEAKRTHNGELNEEHRDEPQTSDGTLLRSDEEDDEEAQEARSWRR